MTRELSIAQGNGAIEKFSPKWPHTFPGCSRSLAPTAIETPSIDVMGHARQASSTYARFDRLDIASGGRQRPSHFHPIVDTHPHTHTPIFSTQSSLVVTHAYAVGTGVLVRRSAATSALGRSAAVRERRSLRGAAQRSSGDDHVGLSFQNQRSPREPASTSSLPQHEVESSPRLERQAKSFSLHGGTFFLRWFLCSSSSLTMPGRIRGRGTSLCPVSQQVVARRQQGAPSFFGFLPSGPTRSLDATDHRLG